ncbi:hypothetical protein [uncultured Thiothrix sp.]|uniref:type IV pilus assembly protein FimV n=1 Tax=uncultured Thiothrix sp. TaxID=223185 RepID=UPI002631D10F|nr:hypothetical protein [uncultured Thiothrix sp.]HMT92909.1 hypothetical protein [Thiolinea sp.]
MNKQTLGLVLIIASGYPVLTHALSLGDIQFNSRVNEPFKARIELLHATPQELSKLQVHIAPPSIFAQAQLQRPAFIDSLKFARSAKNGKHYLIISSPQPVVEADFNLLLEVTSSKGDLLKRYSVSLNDSAESSSKDEIAQPSGAKLTNPASIEKLAAPVQARPTVVNQEVQPILALAQAPEGITDNPVVETRPVVDAPNTPLNLAVDTDQLSASTVIEPEAAVPIPVSIPIERSAGIRPNTAKVAIPLPQLAFKYKYRVRKNDTIFSIAERLRVGQLNLDEKVLALYARNPKAFVNGDLTQLKRGAVLRTPSVVGRKPSATPIPRSTQLVRKALPLERPVQAQAIKHKFVSAPVLPATRVLASVPALIDSPLARAVHELQVNSQLQLVDLQERLTQAQQLLQVRVQESNQLKELVQEKNRLLSRREAELAELQAQAQVVQQQAQAQISMNAGVAGPEGKTEVETVLSVPQPRSVTDENTWQGVLTSPLVWQVSGASTLLLLLLSFWQRRRNADQLMQLQVQNSILMPEIYADEQAEVAKQETNLLDFLWGEEELEQAREQLQNLRHSMASLREQSQRLQAYLNPTSPLSARSITSLQASYQL